MPSARRRSASASGKSGGTTAAVIPSSPHGADVELAIDLLARQPFGDQLVAAELLAEQALELRRLLGDAVDLEHVGEHRPAAIGLEVEERVADPERHLVAQLGRAQRVAADEDRGHQASLPISERSTNCRMPPWRKYSRLLGRVDAHARLELRVARRAP